MCKQEHSEWHHCAREHSHPSPVAIDEHHPPRRDNSMTFMPHDLMTALGKAHFGMTLAGHAKKAGKGRRGEDGRRRGIKCVREREEENGQHLGAPASEEG